MVSAVTTPEWIENAYGEHRRYVLKVLSRRCGWMEPDECEEIFQEAYLVLLERVRDGRLDVAEMAPAQVRAFLTQTAINKALDEGKRAGRARSVPLEAAELTVADEARAPEDVASAGLEGARVREIVSDLSERKRAIVKMRFFFERSPDEIQQFLGISERVYRRELERAMRQIEDGYSLVRDGSYCDSRRSGIIALIAGISGPGRAKAAREHLATCPSCSAWAAQMRDAARAVGAFVPLPDLLLPRGPFERLVGIVDSLRGGAAEAGATAKQHAASLSARVDQASAGVLGGARPGAAAAVVAGCIAFGGGAYCAVKGVPDALGGGGKHQVVHHHRAAKKETRQAAPPVAETPPVTSERVSASPAGAARSSHRQAQRAKQHQRQEAKARAAKSAKLDAAETAPKHEAPSEEPIELSEPIPEEEFEFEGTPTPAAPPPTPPSSPSQPPPGGEFGP